MEDQIDQKEEAELAESKADTNKANRKRLWFMVAVLGVIIIIILVGLVERDQFIELLDEEDEWTRIRAAQSLGELKDPKAVDPLIACLKRDSSWEVCEQVILALHKIGDPRGLAAIKKSLYDVVAEHYLEAMRSVCRNRGLASPSSPVKQDIEAALLRYFNNQIYREWGFERDFKMEYDRRIRMANDFLNCGNAELQGAAREWARRHGYTIGPGGAQPSWTR